MGAEGRLRAVNHFSEHTVLDKQVEIYARTLEKREHRYHSPEMHLKKKRLQFAVKRLADIGLSLACLSLLFIPFVIIGISIKIDSKGPVFFRQQRAGRW